MINRGMKKYDPDEPEEFIPMMPPPRVEVKMEHKKPPRKKPRYLECYEAFRDSKGSREDVAAAMNIKPESAGSYIWRGFVNSDAERLRDKLGLTNEDLERFYTSRKRKATRVARAADLEKRHPIGMNTVTC